jgi:hypothetical protein
MGFDSDRPVMVRSDIFGGKLIYKNILCNYDNSDYYNNVF